MKRLLVSLAAIALAAPAMAQDAAQGATFAELDADQNGELSFQELTAVAPELTVEQFAAADVDANGALSEDEYTAFTATQ